LAAASGGVFINPALTEPFGLTLIEAAASGLPIIATTDGGPQDIIGNCQNGYLIDPLNASDMAAFLLKLLRDREVWSAFAQAGLRGVQEHYSWYAHAEAYLHAVRSLLDEQRPVQPRRAPVRRPMPYHDRAIFTTLDRNLVGDTQSLDEFINVIRRHRQRASFGIATARSLVSALKVMRRYHIPVPDVLITSMGSEIYYAPELEVDQIWTRHIDHLWTPGAVRSVLSAVPGLNYLPKSEQGRFNISYQLDTELGGCPRMA
jgi:sucrose-phosphate synthase